MPTKLMWEGYYFMVYHRVRPQRHKRDEQKCVTSPALRLHIENHCKNKKDIKKNIDGYKSGGQADEETAIKSHMTEFGRAEVVDKCRGKDTLILTHPDDGKVSMIVEPSIKLEWAFTA